MNSFEWNLLTTRKFSDQTGIATELTILRNFFTFVFNVRYNRLFLVVSIVVILIQLICFKYFYPSPGFINGDSYSYIISAFYNLKVDTYPIGYSKFIRLFSVLSTNDVVLVSFQYLLTQISLVYLLFTLFFFYKISNWTKILLAAFTITNPVFLYLANYISSDSLFFSLSIFWFSSLIWIINTPTRNIIIAHVIVLFFAFTVRYNALTYPVVSFLGFVISRKGFVHKLLGFCIGIFLIGYFIHFTSRQYKSITGVNQFSPFSGWQIANNALYAYRFVDSAKRKELPNKFKGIDLDVRTYFDSTRDLKKNPQEMLYASTIYMWDSISPLRIYMEREARKDSISWDLKKWARVAPLYNEYGKVLILTYPKTFLSYYIWPNFLKFYAPPVEFLGTYSTNVDTIPPVAKQWFWLSTDKLKIRVSDMKVNVFNYYPIFSGILNAVYIMMSISFFTMGGSKKLRSIFELWMIGTLFWSVNLCFSVFASPVALRFQLVPLILCYVFNLILLDSILSMGASKLVAADCDNTELDRNYLVSKDSVI